MADVARNLWLVAIVILGLICLTSAVPKKKEVITAKNNLFSTYLLIFESDAPVYAVYGLVGKTMNGSTVGKHSVLAACDWYIYSWNLRLNEPGILPGTFCFL